MLNLRISNSLSSGVKQLNWKLLALVFVCFLSRQDASADMTQTLSEQGDSAFKNKDYGAAVGWYQRAEGILNGEKEPLRDAELWEKIGTAYLANNKLSEAEEALKRARFKYEEAQGAMGPGAASVLDRFGEIFIRRREYGMASGFLRNALEYSLGAGIGSFNDIGTVPYRVERLAYLATISNGNVQGEYKGGIAALANRQKAAPIDKIDSVKDAMKRTFVYWKQFTDRTHSSADYDKYKLALAEYFPELVVPATSSSVSKSSPSAAIQGQGIGIHSNPFLSPGSGGYAGASGLQRPAAWDTPVLPGSIAVPSILNTNTNAKPLDRKNPASSNPFGSSSSLLSPSTSSESDPLKQLKDLNDKLSK